MQTSHGNFRKQTLVLNVLATAVIVFLLYLCVSACMENKYWAALLNFFLAGVNVFTFYTRRRRRQCKTCGYFVVPPEISVELKTSLGSVSSMINPGVCLKKLNFVQMGELYHNKFCWKKPDKTKNSMEVRAWNERLFELKIETKEW